MSERAAAVRRGLPGAGAGWPRTLVVSIALVAAPVVASRVAPDLFNGLRASILGTGLVFAIGALSLNILMGYAGQISLGHAAFVGAGALAMGIVTGPEKLGLSFMAGLPVAALAGAGFAFLVGLPALRIRGLYLAISTVAFGEALARFIFPLPALSGGNTGIAVPRPRAGTFVFVENADYVAIVVAALIGVWLLDRNLTRSRLGRAMFGIRDDEQVAASFGIDVAHTKLTAFVLAGALAGIAGAMWGPLLGLAQANVFDFDDSLFYVIIIVVGGLGSRHGAVIAAVLFAALPRLLVGLTGWDRIIGAALLVYTIARHPGGLAQAAREAKERTERPRDDDDDTAVPLIARIADPARRAEAPAGAAALEVRGLAMSFGGLRVLEDASMAVPAGTITGLIGPNGAGKSTLFNCASGFLTPDAGTVHMFGRDVTALGPHRRAALGMGRTFQMVGLARNLTVLENFMLAQHGSESYGTAASLLLTPAARAAESRMRERSREAIAALGFERFTDTPVRNLSGGQQRIVELGCALVTSPALLLLDEPSAGMSPAATESLAAALRGIRDELGRSVLLIEHHIPLVLDVCDSVSVLALGRMIASGAPADVIGDPGVVAAYLGEEPA